MILAPLFALFSLISVVCGRAAPRSRDSPRNAVYKATFDRGITGSLTFSSFFGYVAVRVRIAGLPRTGGPFMYHIHERAISSSRDCASALGHFNPYDGTLNARTWALHEVGDLSGKHGTIPGTSYRRTYIDPYCSLNPWNRAYFGRLSIVVHLNDGTRIACANIHYQRRSSPQALMAGDQSEADDAPPQNSGPDMTEVIDGVTEIIAADYAKETENLAQLSAELNQNPDAVETGSTS
ncbi:hypothetical protein JCM33374_g1209 [Metschnikowia sp. JCM 33374]|nr:hypothetical protein JCM33374_g1209 [Metschnikowia sp. JCM 33374]